MKHCLSNLRNPRPSLQQLVHVKPKVPKVILDNQLAMEFYRKIVKEIILDINKKYATYMEKKNLCHCELGNFSSLF
jgi:hypothetical protein